MLQEKCACQGAYLDKFVRPSILVKLSERPMHGFQLLKALQAEAMLPDEMPDQTGLYRTLRRMEEEHLLSSYFEDGERARQRRVYEITQDGRECLSTWRSTLEKYAARVGDLLSSIETAMTAE